MQQNTVTLIVAGAGICGTLGGIVIGHFLTRSSQRDQWLRDCKKEEFRELLTALADSFRSSITMHSGAVLDSDAQMKMIESHSNALRVIRSRIFIANTVTELGIELRWAEAIDRHRRTLDVAALSTLYNTLRVKIVEIATERSK